MECSACPGSVEKAIKRLPGILEADIDLLNNTALVLFYPSLGSEETIRETIECAGFLAVKETSQKHGQRSGQACRIHQESEHNAQRAQLTLRKFLPNPITVFYSQNNVQPETVLHAPRPVHGHVSFASSSSHSSIQIGSHFEKSAFNKYQRGPNLECPASAIVRVSAPPPNHPRNLGWKHGASP